MAIALDHLIIPAKDKLASARFLADILGLEAGEQWAIFVPVRTSNGVMLDFADAADFRPMHFAFLVSDEEFDRGLERVKSKGIKFFAEFNRTGPGEINRLYGGRGFYFDDPNGHLFELITKSYGPTPEMWIDGKAVRGPG